MLAVVTGSRSYSSPEMVWSALEFSREKAQSFSVFVGDCKTGADAYALQWCRETQTPCRVFEADWSIGRRGGPERNRRMIQAALETGERVLVLAFPQRGAKNLGTMGCVRLARQHGLTVAPLLWND